MEQLIAKLNIDLDRRQPPGEVTVSAKQGDDQSREIIIALRSSGVAWEVPSSAALRLRLLKPDGKAVYNNLPQSTDGKVHVTLEGQMLTAAGLARADIEITEGGALLSSFLFFADITEQAVPDGTIESTDEFGALQDALDRVEPAVEACETATDAANSAASSATSKISEMDQLKGDLETAEAARVKAEQGRVSAESTRVSQESARKSAEQQRQTDSAAAVSAANTAASRADTAADNANSKASLADTAAQLANTKAGLADTAANAANTAATSAMQAAQAAQTQAGAAESAAGQAQAQAQAAQNAASAANNAAGSANAAADRANEAAGAIEGTEVGDLAVRVQTLEGEMDTAQSGISSLRTRPYMEMADASNFSDIGRYIVSVDGHLVTLTLIFYDIPEISAEELMFVTVPPEEEFVTGAIVSATGDLSGIGLLSIHMYPNGGVYLISPMAIDLSLPYSITIQYPVG